MTLIFDAAGGNVLWLWSLHVIQRRILSVLKIEEDIAGFEKMIKGGALCYWQVIL